MAGIQIGSVSVAVVPSAVGFTDKLRAQLIPEADKLGVDLGTHLRAGIDAGLKDITATVKLDISAAMAEIAALRAAAAVPITIAVAVAGTAAAAGAGAGRGGTGQPGVGTPVAAGAGAGAGSGGGGGGSAAAIMANTAALTALTAAMAGARAGANGLAPAVANTGIAAGLATRGFGAFWGILRGGVGLFGSGATAGILFASSLMLIVHGLIEFVAVLLPALVALTIFGLAAAGVISDISTQMTNMNTVMQATGQNIGPFKGGLQNLQDAVRPAVYQLFGDVLLIMGSKMGIVQQVAVSTGHELDILGARFVNAMTAARTMTGVLSAGPSLVGKFGDIIANIGSIFGTFIRAVPGYAIILLSLFDSFTKIVAVVVNALEPVLAFGLALHGAFLYIGLAVTAVMTLGPWLGRLAVSAAGAAIGIYRLGASMVAAAAGGDVFGAAMLLINATGGPVVWIVTAVAALGVFIVLLMNARSATQQWTDSLQKMIVAAPVTDILNSIMNAQVQVTNRLVTANRDLASTQQTGVVGQTRFGQAITGTTGAYIQAKTKVDELASANRQLSDESALVSFRVDALGKTYGGNTAAMGLLVAAGVTTKQMLDGSSTSWAVIRTMVAATSAAYAAMGQQAGLLGSDLNALNLSSSTQMADVQKLNTAWDSFITVLMVGETAFVTFQQGLQTVGTNAKVAGSSFNGLNAQSLTLRSSWDTMIPQANTLLDAMRSQSAAASLGAAGTTLLSGATRDLVAQMMPYGVANVAVRNSIIGIAQEANPMITTWQQVTHWVGPLGAAGASVDLNNKMAILQGTVTVLSTDVKNLSTAVSASLTPAMARAITDATGGQTVFNNFATAVLNTGVQSKTTATAGDNLALTLLKQTGNAANAKLEFETFTIGLGGTKAQADLLWGSFQTGYNRLVTAANAAGTTKVGFEQMAAQMGIGRAAADQLWISLHKLPAKVPVSVPVSISGGGTITFQEKLTASTVFKLMHLTAMAEGGRVGGKGGPKQDNQLIAASTGEYVVQADAVAKYGNAFMEAINAKKFAGGGLVGSGPGSLSSIAPFAKTTAGQFTQAVETQYTTDAVNVAIADLRAAVAVANAAASSAAAGPGGGSAAANYALAKQLYPMYAGTPVMDAWNYVAMRESGWNQFARNPSSGAYGIPQALPPTKMPFAAQAAGGSNPTAQIRWMWDYMAGSYGGPIGAAAHERAFNWYDEGGWMAPGGFGMNGLNKPEAVLTPEESSWYKDTASSGSSGKTEKLLERIAQAAERAPAQTGAHVAGALNGTSRMAVNLGIHR